MQMHMWLIDEGGLHDSVKMTRPKWSNLLKFWHNSHVGESTQKFLPFFGQELAPMIIHDACNFKTDKKKRLDSISS